MASVRDITGERIGRLVVSRLLETGRKNGGWNDLWLCRCDCGKEKAVAYLNLVKEKQPTRSCGCLRSDSARSRNTTHGMFHTREYRIWGSAKYRCQNPKSAGYERYGGRGITMCERWALSFEAFISDMGPVPGPEYSLDRKNNDGPYSPENCRWATRKEQANNRRSSRLVEFRGDIYTVANLAAALGLTEGTLRRRLSDGIPVERAISPVWLHA